MVVSRKWWLALTMALAVLAAGCGSFGANGDNTTARPQASIASETAANIDPGTPLNKMAPNFTVTDQFGRRYSLSQFRGKVVLLAFQDSECTTVCPLTSQEMVMAKKMLGPRAASEVQLLAVDANPKAYAVADVKSYSEVHGTMHSVLFGTAPLAQLEKIWRQYDIYVAVVHGLIDHTPGVYAINAQGREQRIYLTQMAYNGIGQQAQMFARELARLLPHPTPTSKALLKRALIPESSVHPLNAVKLRALNGSWVTVTDGHPHLLVFLASWLSEMSNVPGELDALNQYQAAAKRHHLPSLVAIDEAPVEPNPTAMPRLAKQAGRLTYPILVDQNGSVATAVGVQDLAWYALVNAKGRVIWAHDASYQWLSPAVLEQDVARAMARP